MTDQQYDTHSAQHTVVTLKSVWLAIILLFVALVAWEAYWRMHEYPCSPDSNKDLWANVRSEVKKLDSDDVILLGSSRVWYDIQIYEWEKLTGRRPLQLALPGSSPIPVLQDLVEHTTFNGTILVGVTPGLFFSNPGPGKGPWRRPGQNIDRYYHRTYAQLFNYWVSNPLQHHLAFLQAGNFFDDTNLESLIDRIPFKGRVKVDPPFPWFSIPDDNRNVTMRGQVTTDTAFAGMIRRVWQSHASGHPHDSADLAKHGSEVIDMVVRYDSILTARGGQIVFVRCPSSGWYRDQENKEYPRERFWNVLLEKTGAKGYHFEDYPELNKYFCPEWSHLATPDAKVFTHDLVTHMIQDGVLKNITQ